MRRYGCVVLVYVPLPMPLVTFPMVCATGVLVSVCGGVAVAFGKDEIPRVPHGFGGGVAVRLSHSAVDRKRGVARWGRWGSNDCGECSVRSQGSTWEGPLGCCWRRERQRGEHPCGSGERRTAGTRASRTVGGSGGTRVRTGREFLAGEGVDATRGGQHKARTRAGGRRSKREVRLIARRAFSCF